MTEPTNATFIASINVMRDGGPLPPGWTEFNSATDTQDGFSAIALENTSTDQIVIAFLGPVVVGSSLSTGALQTDISIMNGQLPVSYTTDIKNFRTTTLGAAKTSTATSNIFVTGNSLGGVAAEYLAKNDGYGGAAYGAPGLPGNTSNPSPSNFVVYVNAMDFVGNAASDEFEGSSFAPSFLRSMYHYGIVDSLGTAVQKEELGSLLSTFENPTVGFSDDTSTAAAGEVSMGAAVTLLAEGLTAHSLDTYASELASDIAPFLSSDVTTSSTLSLEDSLGVLSAAYLFAGAEQSLGASASSVQTNADGTTNVTLTTANGSQSGVASFDADGKLEGGATVSSSAAHVFGTFADFQQSSSAISVDSGANLVLKGSNDTITIADGNPSVTTQVAVTGSNDVVDLLTNGGRSPGDVIELSGASDRLNIDDLSGTFASAASAFVSGFGDPSVLSAERTLVGGTAIPYDAFTYVDLLNADGSRVDTTIIGEDAYSPASPRVDTSLFGSNGLLYETVEPEVNPLTFDVRLWSPTGDNLAYEEFLPINQSSSTEWAGDATFYAGADPGGWTSASISFIGGTQQVQEVIIQEPGQNSITYITGTQGGVSGSFQETFVDATNSITELLTYGIVYDPTTRKDQLGTSVYTPSSYNFYPAGSPNAPVATFPRGAPATFSSAQALWASDIANTIAAPSTSSRPEILHIHFPLLS